jgi:hypothetical protein
MTVFDHRINLHAFIRYGFDHRVYHGLFRAVELLAPALVPLFEFFGRQERIR